MFADNVPSSKAGKAQSVPKRYQMGARETLSAFAVARKLMWL